MSNYIVLVWVIIAANTPRIPFPRESAIREKTSETQKNRDKKPLRISGKRTVSFLIEYLRN